MAAELVSATRATPTTCSSRDSTVMSRTPWVLRPMTLIPFAGMRMSMPRLVMSITSSASATWQTETTAPFRSVVLMVMIPLPPRLWIRYSPSSVRLP